MKLSTRGRYAVMAMVDLTKNTGDQPTSLSDIAKRQGISLSYLEQLFSRLRHKNFIRSTRGPGGGYHLAKAPDEISISSIILAVDEPITAMGCDHKKNPIKEGCTGTGRCLTHKLWQELTQRIHQWLNEITLADVCTNNFEKNETIYSSNFAEIKKQTSEMQLYK